MPYQWPMNLQDLFRERYPQVTLLFTGRPDTEVQLIPGTGHVAASRLPEVIPVIAAWLRRRL